MDRAYRLGWGLSRFASKQVFHTTWTGAENVPTSGSALLVCNHESFVDPFIIGSVLHRPVSYLALAATMAKPVRGLPLRILHSIPLDPSHPYGGIREALRQLGKGGVVGMFPEGTRTEDGELHAFNLGAALLAVRSGAPVIPVAIGGAYAVYPRSARIPHRGHVRVAFGPPIDLAINAEMGQGRPDRYASIGRLFFGAVLDLKMRID